MRDAGPWSRLVLIRGRWLVMAANIDAAQINRHPADPEWGEEDAVYVPNATAAAAPDLLAAAEAMLIDVTDPREGVHRAPRTVYVEALRAAIDKAKGDA